MAGDEKSNSGTAPVSRSSSYKIRLDQFSKRLTSLYESELWGSSDAVAIATPPQSDDLQYLKSSAVNIWLFGFEFPETIMVFRKKTIHVLCSKSKASVLETVRKSANDTVGADVAIHIKVKNGDGSSLMDSILHSIEEEKGRELVIGHIAREAIEGALWSKKLKNENFRLNDVSDAVTDLLAVKDSDEILNIKNAATLTATVMKNFIVPRLEKIVDEEKQISHSSLSDEAEKVITEPFRVRVKLDAENVDICYPPMFQSGGRFDLRPGAASDEEMLFYGSGSVIVCSIGSSYNRYCSNLARTFLIAATPEQRKAYRVLLRAQEAAIIALRPGRRIGAAYEAAVGLVEKEAPELVPNMTRLAGAGIGLEFRESGLSITAKNGRLVRESMVFNVSVGFKNLDNKSSILLADTVIVGKDKTVAATRISSKSMCDVAWEISDGHDEKQRKPEVAKEPNLPPSKTKLRSDTKEISKEELRRQHQAELARKKNEETARRLAGQGTATANNRRRTGSDNFAAYRNVNDVPSFGDLMIRIDPKNEAVLLPIHGAMVPFHVATIRNISSQQETTQNCFVRINFNTPDPNSVHVKDVSFRSKDPKHVLEVVQLIKTLRRQFAARESERADRATLVTQERLQLAGNRFKPVKLPELWIRPGFGGRGRKIPGTLEAHTNGFRYSTTRTQERVDIMFGNVKHAIFQPAEREMITLLHFHLYDEIMVGTKKTKDVQFYVEVMEGVQTLGGRRRSGYDPDEIDEEQRERDRKHKINKDFENFLNRVNGVEFDESVRELGFHGVPFKSSVFIVPTTNCLVELIENPFLVVTLSEIEIVNLERAVDLGGKNFDMVVVFKDFKRGMVRIDSIPCTSLDGIKAWLDRSDIKYYESKINMNWKEILKTVVNDPKGFVEGGGWEFLNLEADDPESEESGSESDKGYEPSNSDAESGSDSDLVEPEEDSQEDSESEEEKGKSWEELEREASDADRDKGDESDSEEERRRRKMKESGKARVGPSTSVPKRKRF